MLVDEAVNRLSKILLDQQKAGTMPGASAAFLQQSLLPAIDASVTDSVITSGRTSGFRDSSGDGSDVWTQTDGQTREPPLQALHYSQEETGYPGV